jgi:MATE family multidrug resistance protein
MLKLAAPVVIAELGWMAMGVVDTMMVGRISPEAIGAVSIGGIAFHTVIVFGIGLLLGLDTLVSRAYGAGKLDDCHQSLLQAVYLSLVLTPVLMGLAWLYIPFLRVWGIHGAVEAQAIPYMKALIWSVGPLMLYTAFRRYLQGMGAVRAIMVVLTSANLVNVAANWALVFGHLGFPAFGTAGAGWATCISRTYMCLALFGYVLYQEGRYRTGLSRVSMRIDTARIRSLLSLGLPAATQITLELGVFAVATTLIGKLDPVSLASHQIALNCAAVMFMVPLGISSAGAVRVGHALGRRDIAGARVAGWVALLLGVIFMSGAAVVFFLAPRWILRLFTTDAAVLTTGVSLLYIAALFQISDGIQVVATGILRGAGETRIPMLSTLVGHWFIGLPVAYVLGFSRGWGAPGVWVGLCVGLTTVAVVLLAVWNRKLRPDSAPIGAEAAN